MMVWNLPRTSPRLSRPFLRPKSLRLLEQSSLRRKVANFSYCFRNAFLKLDWNDPSAAQRVFGCLYGAEPSGNVIVPLSVSSMSLFQCVVSAALIFMFLLALRNLLKVR